jgi:hypothetical protein
MTTDCKSKERRKVELFELNLNKKEKEKEKRKARVIFPSHLHS